MGNNFTFWNSPKSNVQPTNQRQEGSGVPGSLWEVAPDWKRHKGSAEEMHKNGGSFHPIEPQEATQREKWLNKVNMQILLADWPVKKVKPSQKDCQTSTVGSSLEDQKAEQRWPLVCKTETTHEQLPPGQSLLTRELCTHTVT